MNITKFNDMVTLNGNQVMTTSLKVAEYFGKRHDNIIRKIRSTINDCADQEYIHRNFMLADYTDEQGKVRPMFNMTKDGFVFLVMGFTGKAALQIKIKYMQAFDWMAE